MPKFLGIGCFGKGLGRKGKENRAPTAQGPAVEHSETKVLIQAGVRWGGCVSRCFSEAVGKRVLRLSCVTVPPKYTALAQAGIRPQWRAWGTLGFDKELPFLVVSLSNLPSCLVSPMGWKTGPPVTKTSVNQETIGSPLRSRQPRTASSTLATCCTSSVPLWRGRGRTSLRSVMSWE